MSESENVKRTLNQAAELAAGRLAVLENDNRQLKYQLSHAKNENLILKRLATREEKERLSQENKSQTLLLFMFLCGCMAAVSIAYSILNCQ